MIKMNKVELTKETDKKDKPPALPNNMQQAVQGIGRDSEIPHHTETSEQAIKKSTDLFVDDLINKAVVDIQTISEHRSLTPNEDYKGSESSIVVNEKQA